jgi:tRNA(fMet)-specific endonuclease VapC
VRYVLDTNIVIAAMSGEARVLARASEVAPQEAGIPLVALAELLYGARRSRRVEENLAEIHRLRSVFPVLPFTEAVAERYGAVRTALAAKGRPKDDFDLVIACTALEHGAILVTNDAALKDGQIEGLVVEDWLAESTR